MKRLSPLLILCLLMTALPAFAQDDEVLSPFQPWVLYRAPHDNMPYLWGINEDGTGRIRLSEQPVLSFAVHPDRQVYTDGRIVAYIGTSPDDLRQDIALYFLTLPDGTISDPIPLTSPATAYAEDVPDNAEVSAQTRADIAAGFADKDALAWSPDGAWLAFLGAQDGVSLDVYSYEWATGEIRWLTTGGAQAYQLWWSPDSTQILHTAASCFLCAGGYYEGAVGLWGARPEGGVITYANRTDARFIAWLDDTELLMDSGYRNGGIGDVRVLDIATSTFEAYDTGLMDDIIYDDNAEHALAYSFGGSPIFDQGDGWYVLDLGTLQAIYTTPDYGTAWWNNIDQLFFLETGDSVIAIDDDGTITDNPPPSTLTPLSQAWTAQFDITLRAGRTGALVVQMRDEAPVTLLEQTALSISLSPNVDNFLYDTGDGLYLVVIDEQSAIPLTDAPLDLRYPYDRTDWQAVWVLP
jgi:hypothetical protein